MKEKLKSWTGLVFLFLFLFLSGVASFSAILYGVSCAVIHTKEALSTRMANAWESYVETQAIARGFAPKSQPTFISRDELISSAAKKYRISPSLIRAIIKKESNGEQYATSSSRACGLMQVLPSHAPRLGLKHWSQLYDEATNIDAGSKIFAWNLDYSKGDLTKALEIYYGGLSPEPKLAAEARVYAKEVLSILARIA